MTLLGCEFQEGLNTTISRKNHTPKYAPFKLDSILLPEYLRYGLVFEHQIIDHEGFSKIFRNSGMIPKSVIEPMVEASTFFLFLSVKSRLIMTKKFRGPISQEPLNFDFSRP